MERVELKINKDIYTALEQENNILKSILNSLLEGVIVADKNGKFIYFNTFAKKILGIGLTDVNLTDWSSVYGCYYPDQITPYPSNELPLARTIKTGEITNDLIFIRNPERPDGILIDVTASPIKNSRGIVTGGTVSLRDVTESQQAEKALRRSEERNRAQFKGFPIPTYVWQHDGDDFVLLDYNDAAETISKKGIRKFLGQKLHEMYANSPYLDIIKSDLLQCFNQKQIIEREMTYWLQTTGEFKELYVRYIFVNPDLVLVHTEDFTERKRNEAQIRKLSSAIEQTADSVVITNKEGIIEYVNPAFENITGFSSKEVIGKTPRMLKSGIHDRKLYKKLWETILTGDPYRGTIINKKKNGEVYWSQQSITPMKNEDGIITNFVSVMKDITDLKKMQEQEFQLRLARELQQLLFKSNLSIPGFDVTGSTHTALETGGDYFDVFPMPDGYYGMAVGDVCGHGIGSALVMTATRAYLRAFARTESDPEIILTRLNQELFGDLDEYHYVTLIFVRLDPQHKTLDYVNAGHVPAYILNSHNKVEHTLNGNGIPLGFLKDVKYLKSKPIKLLSESILVFLTDGITEAKNPDKDEFGYKRALRVIQKHREESAKQISEHLYKALRLFSGVEHQEDDITSLICKMTDMQ
ncbi:MAG: SpoIIE family protein phosphatase [Bacteroidales bacterium]|nr:SpoIIE family protein phosphatase [Bacteroidales bacterium]